VKDVFKVYHDAREAGNSHERRVPDVTEHVVELGGTETWGQMEAAQQAAAGRSCPTTSLRSHDVARARPA
jgi:hypothetical protein